MQPAVWLANSFLRIEFSVIGAWLTVFLVFVIDGHVIRAVCLFNDLMTLLRMLVVDISSGAAHASVQSSVEQRCGTKAVQLLALQTGFVEGIALIAVAGLAFVSVIVEYLLVCAVEASSVGSGPVRVIRWTGFTHLFIMIPEGFVRGT